MHRFYRLCANDLAADASHLTGLLANSWLQPVSQQIGSWFVGALNNWTERDITLDLHFLDNALYDMAIFQDGVNADRNACDFKQVSAKAPANRQLKIHLAPGGGWAAHCKTLIYW
jgi:hypothetical protein